MSQSNQQGISIEILGKEMTIACPEGQSDSLLSAASYLDQKMQDIKEKGGHHNLLNVAMLAALNISHELLNANEANADYQQQIEQRIKMMEKTIEQSLTQQHQDSSTRPE